MAGKKPKLEQFTTPKGIAVWPRLNEPDTKWKAEGEYTAKIRLSGEAAQPLIDRIEVLIEETMEKTKEDLKERLKDAKDAQEKGKINKKLKDLKLSDKSYKPVYDEDGNETGEYDFNIKMKAEVKDKKTGKVKKLTPKLFDAKGKPLSSSVQVWGGTTYKVSGKYNPFVSPKMEVGVSLRLDAVQIINLVTAGSGGSADSYGFGEEDGYDADESNNEGDTDEDSSDDDSSDEDGDEDF